MRLLSTPNSPQYYSDPSSRRPHHPRRAGRFTRTGLLATAAVLALTASAPSAASAAPASTARPQYDHVDCDGWIHNNDPLTGGVDCTNNTGGNVAIRVELTCNWAPDVTGDWVVVGPGQVGESRANCAFFAQGIDHVGWDVEPR